MRLKLNNGTSSIGMGKKIKIQLNLVLVFANVNADVPLTLPSLSDIFTKYLVSRNEKSSIFS